jgi:hypothetical protein
VEHIPDLRNFKLKKQVKLTTALTKELDSTTKPIPDPRNFKLKKQVELTTALTRELESTTEEVEF